MPGYQTKQEQITVIGVNDLTIRSLLDRQQVADPVGQTERLGISSAAWPLSGHLWTRATHLGAQGFALREERLDHEATPGVASFKARLLIHQLGHWTS